MKKQFTCWLCGVLALLCAMPAFAYNKEAQKRLEAQVTDLLRDGK